MLYLHKSTNDTLGNRVKEALLNMSVAHKQIDIEEGESFISENDIVIKGTTNIFRYIESLNRDLEYSRSLSADACIMDNRDGSIC